jgi:cellulose synthase (UDP-forming)
MRAGRAAPSAKEGNLAFFYDHYGYANYDFVVQLDADHVPTDGYLEEMLRGFSDPTVGYVSAPSICDKNAKESWSARGRLYVEGPLHGPLQAGYTGGRLAPLCIGSHYAVRTVALKEIGGLGPELAEDHSTTLIMNAHGWRGVHAINAIAHGAGPQTFGDLATQEFQWSRSLCTILLRYTPLYFGKLPLRLKLQFAFCQLWYPLFSVLMLTMYLLPLVALWFDSNLVGVNYPDFFVRISLLWVLLTGMAFWWSNQQWTRPVEAKMLSWEGTLFLFARWPWSLIGTIAAVGDWMRGSTLDFRVTPKGRAAAEPLPFRVLAPYAFLSAASGLPILLLGGVKIAVGFYVFAAANSLLYAILLLVIIVQHRRENPNARSMFGPDLGTYRAIITARRPRAPAAIKSSAQPRRVTRPTNNP